MRFSAWGCCCLDGEAHRVPSQISAFNCGKSKWLSYFLLCLWQCGLCCPAAGKSTSTWHLKYCFCSLGTVVHFTVRQYEWEKDSCFGLQKRVQYVSTVCGLTINISEIFCRSIKHFRDIFEIITGPSWNLQPQKVYQISSHS